MASARITSPEAVKKAFQNHFDRLREELQRDIKALNSKLCSKGIISEGVRMDHDIDVTLSDISKRLDNEAVSLSTFTGFCNALSEIRSKSHLAAMLERACNQKLPMMDFYPGYGRHGIRKSTRTAGLNSVQGTENSLCSVTELEEKIERLKHEKRLSLELAQDKTSEAAAVNNQLQIALGFCQSKDKEVDDLCQQIENERAVQAEKDEQINMMFCQAKEYAKITNKRVFLAEELVLELEETLEKAESEKTDLQEAAQEAEIMACQEKKRFRKLKKEMEEALQEAESEKIDLQEAAQEAEIMACQEKKRFRKLKKEMKEALQEADSDKKDLLEALRVAEKRARKAERACQKSDDRHLQLKGMVSRNQRRLSWKRKSPET